jgi:RimJ/RimL family protein N-acetyltransferase
MTDRTVGPIVERKPPGLLPDLRDLPGKWMRLEPIAVAHAPSLYKNFAGRDESIWTYLGYGPFVDYDAFERWLTERIVSRDPWFYCFVAAQSNEALGMGAFMRADAANGVIEIGHIWMTPGLQRTREATEAIYLMMKHCFDDLGVRRLEWKCDALNAPSRRAAKRFGFTFEGEFRQHFIVKGRNRDTAWFSIIDSEWPLIRQGFEAWLEPANFDAQGRQKATLQVK